MSKDIARLVLADNVNQLNFAARKFRGFGPFKAIRAFALYSTVDDSSDVCVP